MRQSHIGFGWQPKARIILVLLVVAAQAIAAAYFLVDGIDDILKRSDGGISFEIVMDCIVALALIAGLIVATLYARHMSAEIRHKDRSLSIARGALAQQVSARFEEWGLTTGEAEVALFAMKGCNITEIARLRNAANGTVRSQLSQVYTKAGVSSQSMLVSLFIEDLLDIPSRESAFQN